MSNRARHLNFRAKTMILVIVAVLSLGSLAYLILVPKTLQVDTALVNRGEFVQELRADAYFRSRERVTITAFASGDILEQLTVKTGDHVQKDQVITSLYWDKKSPVRSPMAGIVSRVFRENKGPINRGEPIIEVINPNSLEVVTELLTTDATQVSPGNPVRVLNWGGPGELLGNVRMVSRAGFVKASALGVEEERTEVIADLAQVSGQTLEHLGHNFHTELRIQTNRVENALKIPLGALVREGEILVVYQVVNQRAKRVVIDIGLRNSEEALVKSGVTAGDRVIVYPGDRIKDGARLGFRSSQPID